MKKNLRKIISLVLVLAMSLAISIPAFAAEKDTTSQPKNEVVLQRSTGAQTIKLPADISDVELAKLKSNILKYGNQVLSQEEVDHINAKAAASGLVYGPWYGGYSEYYSMSPTETLSFFAGIYSLISLFAGAVGLTTITIADVATGVYSTAGGPAGLIYPGEWVKATVRKQYREVKYSDGTFAYFQTGFWTNNLNMANKSLGSPYAIFSGGMY